MKIAIAAIGLLALAGCSDIMGSGASYGESEAQAGAEFRFAARDAVAGLQPVCAFTDDADLLSRYEPLNARFAVLE